MYLLDDGKRPVIPRTVLTYPAHLPKLHRNAADPSRAPVDCVMADFEDACPYEHKGERSRRVTLEALNTLDFGKRIVTVRPNNIRSPFFRGDLEAIMLGAPNRFHGIVLPKVRERADVDMVAAALDELERRGGWHYRVGIEALIETPRALLHVDEIASASDRMCGLVFGIADFAASLGIREVVVDQNRNFHYAKQATVVAAKAYGLHALDNVYLRLWREGDAPERIAEIEQGLREKNLGAAALGMDGTWVVHPQQAAIANECYTPAPAQIEEARRIIRFYHQRGGGSMVNPATGEMVDEATIKMALIDLAKGVQAGMASAEELAEWSARSRAITGYDIVELMRGG
jgi:citrate lyase beta subunit